MIIELTIRLFSIVNHHYDSSTRNFSEFQGSISRLELSCSRLVLSGCAPIIQASLFTRSKGTARLSAAAWRFRVENRVIKSVTLIADESISTRSGGRREKERNVSSLKRVSRIDRLVLDVRDAWILIGARDR